MSDKPQTTDTTAETETQEAKGQREPRFSRERLLSADGPRIAGHPHHVIVGALHEDDAKSFTRAQVGRKIDQFLKREITPDEQEG